MSAAAPLRHSTIRSLFSNSPSSSALSFAVAAAAAAAAAAAISFLPDLEAQAAAASSSPAPHSTLQSPSDAADVLLRCKTLEETEQAVLQLHAAMSAAAGQELGGLQAKTLVKVLKHAISMVQGSLNCSAAVASVRFIEQLCSTSSSARRCVIDAGGCHFLSLTMQHAVRQQLASCDPKALYMQASACAASVALSNLAAVDAKRVLNDSYNHIATALCIAAEQGGAVTQPLPSSAVLALALAAPVIIAVAPQMQSTTLFHAFLSPFHAAAAHALTATTPSSPSLSLTAHAFAILLASHPLPPASTAAALPRPLALFLNLMEGAGPAEFRVAAATHAHLLLQPKAGTKNYARAVVNSLFHTALLPYSSSQVPPMQCAAVLALSSAALVPSVLPLIFDSFSLSDVVALLPHLPVAVAAGIARLTAASAVDAASCAKLVDMRADELISNACAANPKCKELRDAAGVMRIGCSSSALCNVTRFTNVQASSCCG
jgi:hypothetical protein